MATCGGGFAASGGLHSAMRRLISASASESSTFSARWRDCSADSDALSTGRRSCTACRGVGASGPSRVTMSRSGSAGRQPRNSHAPPISSSINGRAAASVRNHGTPPLARGGRARD
jgi:hypothetical protein